MLLPGARVADIGSDHAYLPIYLLSQRRAALAIASDISAPGARRARENAARYGVSPDIRVGDGLSTVSPGECDTVVIAGMGGESIAAILADAPWALDGVRLICQPATRPAKLRAFLYGRGCGIVDERVVRDAGLLYTVIAAHGGAPVPEHPMYEHASPPLFERAQDEDTREYIRRAARKARRDRLPDAEMIVREIEGALGESIC